MGVEVCTVDGWSIVASASSNSQFAGVLAGFLFAGFLILFSKEGPKNAQTMSLFVATFVLLGFDSYLFSSVTGSVADPICARVWHEGVIASGLLALGAVALVCGIGWLVIDFLEATVNDESLQQLRREGRTKKIRQLATVASWTPLIVMLPACFRLASTNALYFNLVYHQKPPIWAWKVAVAVPIAGASIAVISRIVKRLVRLRLATITGRDYVFSVVALLAFTMVAPILSNTAFYPAGFWEGDLQTSAIIATVSSLVLPTSIAALLVAAVPDLSADVRDRLKLADTGVDQPGEGASINSKPDDEDLSLILTRPRWLVGRVEMRVSRRR